MTDNAAEHSLCEVRVRRSDNSGARFRSYVVVRSGPHDSEETPVYRIVEVIVSYRPDGTRQSSSTDELLDRFSSFEEAARAALSNGEHWAVRGYEFVTERELSGEHEHSGASASDTERSVADDPQEGGTFSW